MKSKTKKSTYKAIYRLLNRVSPLPYDCGQLCDACCCKDTGENMGIYLYPGEDKLFTRKESWLKWESENAEDFDFPLSWKGKIYFVKCKSVTDCVREYRPLQCRFFPLSPHITKNNQLILIKFNQKLPYSCPLIEEKRPLDKDFIKATYTVIRRLIEDPLIYDLVLMDSRDRDKEELEIIYSI